MWHEGSSRTARPRTRLAGLWQPITLRWLGMSMMLRVELVGTWEHWSKCIKLYMMEYSSGPGPHIQLYEGQLI